MVLYAKTYVHLWSYVGQLSLEWEKKKVVDDIKTNILCSITFIFRKSRPLWNYVENTVEPGRSQMKI